MHGSDLALGEKLHLQPGFDESLYLWEQNYCLENCLGLYFQIPAAAMKRLREHPAFIDLAKRLASYRRVLIHRDLQSQNIIVWDEQAYLIDFQGLRPGLPQYDLASLLYDPYVNLPRRSVRTSCGITFSGTTTAGSFQNLKGPTSNAGFNV